MSKKGATGAAQSAVTRKPERRDADIISVGSQMSNVLYNLRQRPTFLTAHEKEQFDMLQTKWDVVKFQYLKSFKRKKSSAS